MWMGWCLPLLDSYTRQDEGQLSSSSPVCHSEGPGEIKRREVVPDPVVSPEEIMSREVELGCESWTFFASSCYSTAVQRTLSL